MGISLGQQMVTLWGIPIPVFATISQTLIIYVLKTLIPVTSGASHINLNVHLFPQGRGTNSNPAACFRGTELWVNYFLGQAGSQVHCTTLILREGQKRWVLNHTLRATRLTHIDPGSSEFHHYRLSTESSQFPFLFEPEFSQAQHPWAQLPWWNAKWFLQQLLLIPFQALKINISILKRL